ncbi:MAG: hypothetical protein ACYDDE_00755 [bacterium]
MQIKINTNDRKESLNLYINYDKYIQSEEFERAKEILSNTFNVWLSFK